MARMPLVAAGKYAAVTSAAKPARTGAHAARAPGEPEGRSLPSSGARAPLSQALKKAGPAFGGTAGRVARQNGLVARSTQTAAQTSGLGIFVPKQGKALTVGGWFYRELREGGYVREYLRAEKALMDRAIRKVARRKDGWRQNNKSDLQLLCSVPARLFFRWKAVDPHFWEDDKNLKSLKRDNPDLPVFI